MKEINLTELIRGNRFGSISLRDSLPKILDELGDVEVSPGAFDQNIETINFGSFSFTIYKKRLVSFYTKWVIDDYQLRDDFHFKTPSHKLTSWFEEKPDGITLNSVRKHFRESKISFQEEPYYDALTLVPHEYMQLQFWSPLSKGKMPQEWRGFNNENLNWKFGAIFCSLPPSVYDKW